MAFGWFVHAALTKSNNNGKYTDIITKLLTVLTALAAELNDVDSNLIMQTNSTKDVNLFISNFATFMSDNEYVITRT